MSNSPYSDHKSKEADLYKEANSSDYPFLKLETLNHFLKRITGIKLKNIKYNYISPVYITNFPPKVSQMPEGWISTAYTQNHFLKSTGLNINKYNSPIQKTHFLFAT